MPGGTAGFDLRLGTVAHHEEQMQSIWGVSQCMHATAPDRERPECWSVRIRICNVIGKHKHLCEFTSLHEDGLCRASETEHQTTPYLQTGNV
jgi:hypothetical protein